MFEVITNEAGDTYAATVYSCSYESPIYHLDDIASQLKDKGVEKGHVLFDTLLSKGDVSTRFLECYYENDAFVKQTFKNVEIAKGDDIRKKSSQFYKDAGVELGLDLEHSMLTTVQKNIITHGYTL